MKIKETPNNYGFDVEIVDGISVAMKYDDFAIEIDKKQAASLIEVLRDWVEKGIEPS